MMASTKFFRPRLGSLHLGFLVATYCALLLNNTFWSKAASYLKDDPAAYAALFVAIVSLFTIATTFFSAKYIAKPFLIFFIGVASMSAWFTDKYGVLVDTDMVRNIFETTQAESRDLLTLGLVVHVFMYFVIPSLLILWVRVSYKPFKSLLVQNTLAIGLCAIVFAGIGFSFYKPYSAVVRTKRDLVKTLNPITPLISTAKYFYGASQETTIVVKPLGEDAKILARRGPPEKPRVAIVVVGETTRGANFSLGSYSRETNPLLARQGVTYYPNFFSCGTATDVSLPCMFSNLKRSGYTHTAGLENENVLDVLSRAGVDVTWIENNTGSKGVADRVKYVKITGSNDPRFCQDGNCRDEIFLDKVDEWLNNVKQDSVLVLHQLGNHGPAYYKRYPDAFRKFTPDCQTTELSKCEDQAIVNAYDNAILYTDFVLSNIIDRLKTKTDVVSPGLMYISDHGESLGENGLYLHGTPYFMAPDEQIRIPMLTWFSDDFTSSIGVDRNCLRDSTNATLSHDNLFSSMIGMMNVTTSAYERQLDIFAPCQDPSVRP